MSSYKPRRNIPDEWAVGGLCPICDHKSLWVERTAEQPDRLSCTNCEVSFEMEVDGPHIRMVVLPPEYAVYIQPAWETWMTVHEIRQQIKSPAAAIGNVPTMPSTPIQGRLASFTETNETDPFEEQYFEPLSQEDINSRAAGFASLGNSPAEIRTILTKIKAKPEQIEIALTQLSKNDKAKPKNYPRTIIYVLIILVLCLGAAAVLLPLLNLPKYISAVSPVVGVLQGSLSTSQVPEETPTQNPLEAVFVLPSDGQVYFDTIKNLAGKYRDKAGIMGSVYAPAELATLNNEIVTRYHLLGQTELAYDTGQAEFVEKCSSVSLSNRENCNKIMADNSALKIQFLDEESQLKGYWSTTACDGFKQYYSKYNVIWPYGVNQCPAP